MKKKKDAWHVCGVLVTHKAISKEVSDWSNLEFVRREKQESSEHPVATGLGCEEEEGVALWDLFKYKWRCMCDALLEAGNDGLG